MNNINNSKELESFEDPSTESDTEQNQSNNNFEDKDTSIDENDVVIEDKKWNDKLYNEIISSLNELKDSPTDFKTQWEKDLEKILLSLENPSLEEALKVVDQLNDYSWQSKKQAIINYVNNSLSSELELANEKLSSNALSLIKVKALQVYEKLLPSNIKKKEIEFQNSNKFSKTKENQPRFEEITIDLPLSNGKNFSRKFTKNEFETICNDFELRKNFEDPSSINNNIEGEDQAKRLSDLVRSIFKADYAVTIKKKEEQNLEKLALQRDAAAEGWMIPNALGSTNEDKALQARAKANEIRNKSAAMMAAVRSDLSAALREGDVLLNDYFENEHRRLTVTFFGILDSINKKSLKVGDFNITVSKDSVEKLKSLDRNRDEWTNLAKSAEQAGNYENAFKFYTKLKNENGRRRNAGFLAIELEKNNLFGNAIEYYEIAGLFNESKRLRKDNPDLQKEAFAVLEREELYQKSVSSVVRVNYSFRSNDSIIKGHGSGFFFKRGGYILTNNHVIEQADNDILVHTHDERVYKARIIAKTKSPDLAVLQISLNDHDIIRLAQPEDIKIGTKVMLFGFPLRDLPTATANDGMISNTDRSYDGVNVNQLDVSANKGNSGGPVLDYRGRLVGVLTWGYPASEADRFNFAQKVSVVRDWLNTNLGNDFTIDG